MRFFMLARNDSVIINDYISMTIIDIDDDGVILTIDAPEWVAVKKMESSSNFVREDKIEHEDVF